MGKDLDAVLVPGDPGPGNSPGHADEHDLVTQEELVVKVGGLLNLGALRVYERNTDVVQIGLLAIRNKKKKEGNA